jgi:hypothetical protein
VNGTARNVLERMNRAWLSDQDRSCRHDALLPVDDKTYLPINDLECLSHSWVNMGDVDRAPAWLDIVVPLEEPAGRLNGAATIDEPRLDARVF